MKPIGTRAGKLIFRLLLGFAALYALLLIPDAPSPPPSPGDAQPFIWDQDEYWSLLEASFLQARQTDIRQLDERVESGMADIGRLLDSCDQMDIGLNSPLLIRLETAVFELAPVLAAHPVRLPGFIAIHRRLRSVIKDKSRKWDMDSPNTRNRLYRLLYGTRTAVEEILLQMPPDSIAIPVTVGDEPSSTPAAEMMGVTIHSGDILVSRGGAPTSALIARGNDYPGNFSHVALAHVDEDSHEISIVEAHIEQGVAIAPAESYLRDTKLRILVLRPRHDLPAIVADPMLPHKAATLALRRAQQEHIPYDFEMNFRDDSKLFCSEVASDAYAQTGIALWMGISRISSPGVRSWLAAFGITHFETQEPSDLEYDPQLTVVAEWLDPETLYKDHLDNAVIDAMLEQAEIGKRLDYNRYNLPLARLAKAYSMLLNLFGGVGPIPEGMSTTAALKNDQFSKRHRAIKARLMEFAEEFHRNRGYRPPYWELVRLARKALEE